MRPCRSSKKAIAQALKRLRPNITDGQKMVGGRSWTVWRGIGLRSEEPDPDGSGAATSSRDHGTNSGERSTFSRVSMDYPYCFEKVDPPKEEDRGEGEGAPNNNRKKPFKPFKPLSVEEVVRELRRPNSGARINLPLFLAGATTLEILTKSVLVAKGLSTDAWEEHAGVVQEAAADPRNHGVECECGWCT